MTGQVAIVFITMFSEDGITAIPDVSVVSQCNFIDIGGVDALPVPQQVQLFQRLPQVPPTARYIMVAWLVLTSDSVSQWSFGPCEIALELQPDSETSIDIG